MKNRNSKMKKKIIKYKYMKVVKFLSKKNN